MRSERERPFVKCKISRTMTISTTTIITATETTTSQETTTPQTVTTITPKQKNKHNYILHSRAKADLM